MVSAFGFTASGFIALFLPEKMISYHAGFIWDKDVRDQS